MADRPATGAGTDLQELQRRFWDGWLELAQHATAGGGASGWPEAMQRWWAAMAPALAGADQDLLSKLLPQAQGYLHLGELSQRIIGEVADATKQGEAWQSAIGKSIDQIREAFFQTYEGADQAHPGLAAFWGLPLDTWQRVASSLSAYPGDALHAMREAGLRPEGLQQGLDKAMGVPALGYTREWQEQLQRGVRLWADYQRAVQDYTAVLRGAAERALELLQQRLLAMGEDGRRMERLRELYNLWVDCSEEAYAEVVRGEEYAAANGRMINALMRYKHHGQNLVNECLSAWNVPNRTELDTAHARVQGLRRRLQRIQDREFDDAHTLLDRVLRLEEQVGDLRAELRAAGAAPAPEPAPEPAPKTRASRAPNKRSASAKGGGGKGTEAKPRKKTKSGG